MPRLNPPVYVNPIISITTPIKSNSPIPISSIESNARVYPTHEVGGVEYKTVAWFQVGNFLRPELQITKLSGSSPTEHLKTLRAPGQPDQYKKGAFSPALHNASDTFVRYLEKQYDNSRQLCENPQAAWRVKSRTISEVKEEFRFTYQFLKSVPMKKWVLGVAKTERKNIQKAKLIEEESKNKKKKGGNEAKCLPLPRMLKEERWIVIKAIIQYNEELKRGVHCSNCIWTYNSAGSQRTSNALLDLDINDIWVDEEEEVKNRKNIGSLSQGSTTRRGRRTRSINKLGSRRNHTDPAGGNPAAKRRRLENGTKTLKLKRKRAISMDGSVIAKRQRLEIRVKRPRLKRQRALSRTRIPSVKRQKVDDATQQLKSPERRAGFVSTKLRRLFHFLEATPQVPQAKQAASISPTHLTAEIRHLEKRKTTCVQEQKFAETRKRQYRDGSRLLLSQLSELQEMLDMLEVEILDLEDEIHDCCEKVCQGEYQNEEYPVIEREIIEMEKVLQGKKRKLMMIVGVLRGRTKELKNCNELGEEYAEIERKSYRQISKIEEKIKRMTRELDAKEKGDQQTKSGWNFGFMWNWPKKLG